MARGEENDLTQQARRATQHPQHRIQALQAKRPKQPEVHHIVVTVEKTFSGIESKTVPPLEETLRAMNNTSPSDCPTYRFKEWTSHDKSGLEFTLATIIPLLPQLILFGGVDLEALRVNMVRCITAHQLWELYGVTAPPGDVYHPAAGWWLLVISHIPG